MTDKDAYKRDPRSPPPDLDYEPHGWIPTDKGKFHLDTLLGISFPTQEWVAANRTPDQTDQ